jgi:hypothetical protein
MSDDRRQTCDVVGCEEPAEGSYMDPRQDRTHFRLCAAHFARVEAGERPVVVAKRLDLADVSARPGLLLDPR